MPGCKIKPANTETNTNTEYKTKPNKDDKTNQKLITLNNKIYKHKSKNINQYCTLYEYLMNKIYITTKENKTKETMGLIHNEFLTEVNIDI